MILYDQDFRFIGMSAETLTFLGYEDIDEFTSMHSDFADLFVKKEGFIHKFENFSWIHYILYSGAANKKAYVSRKNGEELCVDITIKEVFLNHAYDGLRMIYSVKLINENFTKISHSDVHDNRSAQSREFSLSNLTKDLKIADETAVTREEPASKPTPEPLPEPLDFKLDIPEDSILAAQQPEQPSQPAKEPEQLTVPLFDLPDTDSPEERPKETAESGFTLNFPTIETEHAEKEEEETPAAPLDFATAFAGDKESTATPPPLPSESNKELSEDFKRNFIVEEEREEEKREEPVFSFDLAPAAETEKQPEEENQIVHPDKENREHEEEKSTDIFSFQLLKERAEESSPEPQTPHCEAETAVADTTTLQIDERSTEPESKLFEEPESRAPKEEQEPLFNFNFLQNSQAAEERAATQEKQSEAAEESPEPEVQIPLHDLLKTDTESTPEQEQTVTHETSASEPSAQMQEKSANTQFSFSFFTQEAPEAHQDQFHTARAEELKSTLINQIKHDIEEIDQDIQIGQSEKEDASLHPVSAVHEETPHQHDAEKQPEEESMSEENPSKTAPFSFHYTPETPETPEKEIFVKPDLMHNAQQHEENSFEETLKNIFTASQSIAPAEHNSLNKIDTEKPVEEAKQHITTEAIKSPDQNEASDTETLALPKLGSLGLSREEELDFIEEFLDDTAATVGLMQEYLKLEDYSNIKYNLIKISSSAEILHFDQMLEHTRALSAMSDAQQKEAIGAKLLTLLQLTERYKAHFSSMPV